MRNTTSTSKISQGAWLMILLLSLRTIIDIFEDNYVTTLLTRLTGGATSKIAVYFIVKYGVTALGAIFIGRYVKKYALRVFRLGIVSTFLFFIAFINMKLTVFSMLIAASLQGLALIMYYLPFAVINASVVKKSERHNYSAMNGIAGRILGMITPITFGVIIAKTNYFTTGIVILSVIVLELVAAIFIKSVQLEEHKQFEFSNFLKEFVREDANRLFIIMMVCKGVALMGAQRQLINMLIFNQYGSEFQLGKIASLVSVSSILLVALFGKYVTPKKYKLVLGITAGIQLGTVIFLIANTNTVSIVLMRFAFDAVVGIIGLIAENYLYGLAMANAEYKTEYMVLTEVLSNAGRILSWILAIIVSIASMQNTMSIPIAISVINLVFMVMVVMLAKVLNKNDCILEEWQISGGELFSGFRKELSKILTINVNDI